MLLTTVWYKWPYISFVFIFHYLQQLCPSLLNNWPHFILFFIDYAPWCWLMLIQMLINTNCNVDQFSSAQYSVDYCLSFNYCFDGTHSLMYRSFSSTHSNCSDLFLGIFTVRMRLTAILAKNQVFKAFDFTYNKIIFGKDWLNSASLPH